MSSTMARDRGSLPAPNTYSQYKASKQRGGESTTATTTRGIKPAGESGRRGFHPWHFFRIAGRSTSRASALCNILWPVVPAALAVRCESIRSRQRCESRKTRGL